MRPGISLRTLWSWSGSPTGVGYPLIVFLLIYPVFIGYFQEPIPELALPINYHLFDFLGGLGAATGVLALRFGTRHLNPGNKKTAVIVVGWYAAGFIGSLLQFSVAASAGPLPQIYQELLPLGGLSFWTLSFCFTTFTSVLVQNRKASGDLTRAKLSLDFLKANMVQQVAYVHNELQERIRESINPVLNSLSNEIRKLTTNSDEKTKTEATDNLQQAVLELVRPLTHELYRKEPLLREANEDLVLKRTSRLTIREILVRRMTLSVAFNASLPPILIIAFFGGSYWIAAGWMGFIAGCLVTTAMVTLVLTLLNRTTQKIKLPFPAVVAIGIVTGLALSELYVFVPNFLGVDMATNYQRFLALGSGLVLVFTPIFSIAYDTRLFLLANLRKANEESASMVSRLRQEVWLRQKQLAKIIHGGVQSKLNSARIRLTQANTVSPELIDTVLADLDSARKELTASPSEHSLGINEQLKELVDFWKGVCEINLSIEIDAVRVLRLDSSATQAVVEIVSEGIGNAVKHSRAKDVELRISNRRNGILMVELEHPTEEAHEFRSSNGLGTEILNELTLSWFFEIKEGVGRLQAEVPTSNPVAISF